MGNLVDLSSLDEQTATLVLVIVALARLIEALVKSLIARRGHGDGNGNGNGYGSNGRLREVREHQHFEDSLSRLREDMHHAAADRERVKQTMRSDYMHREVIDGRLGVIERDIERLTKGLERASEALGRARRGKGLDTQS